MSNAVAELAGRSEKGLAEEVALLAHRLTVEQLEEFGNEVGPLHSLAIYQLHGALAAQAFGLVCERAAYALPCGAGKTQSIVGFIAALHLLGHNRSIAVSAQQVSALCAIKSKLIKAGVPERLVGLRHSKSVSAEIPWPDTGASDRLYMLVPHVRIWGSTAMPAFCEYEGKIRDVLIWDESLLSTEAMTIELGTAKATLEFARGETDGRTELQHLHEVLRRLCAIFALELANKQADVHQGSSALLLPDMNIDLALQQLDEVSRRGLEGEMLKRVRTLLEMIRSPVSIMHVGSGSTGVGLIQYSMTIPRELSSIAVLDASNPIRDLCRIDKSIRNATTDAMKEFKRFDNVTVNFTKVATGRNALTERYDKPLSSAYAHVVEIVQQIPQDESIVIYTFKGDTSSEPLSVLKRQLRDAGTVFDAPSLRRGESIPRIAFRTWGQETSVNSHSHCQHVILLGVLRRNSLSLGASMAGQRHDLGYRPTKTDIMAVELSELASHVLQAMNRGRCRTVDRDGFASPMTLWLLTKEKGLQGILQSHMPGLKWVLCPLNRIDRPSARHVAARSFSAVLKALPVDTKRISVKSLRQLSGVEFHSDVVARAVEDAVILTSLPTATRWRKVGRSLERVQSS